MSIFHKKLEGSYCQGKRITPGIYYFLIFLLTILARPQAVLAQDNEMLIVQPPETSQFPEMTVSFKLPYAHSEMISGLQLSHLTVYENGELIKPDALNKERSGIHFTLAINPGTPLDLHDVEGVSSYEKLREALVDWAESRSSLIGDSWSFVGDDRVLTSNSRDREIWIDSLNAYQPNFRSLQPQLSSLELAIDLSMKRVVSFGVDKAILFITPAPSADQIEALNEMSKRASSAGIQVSVWMVDEAYYLTNDQGGALLDLANNTGGDLFNYTGSEVFPNPELNLVDLGYYFRLSYQSTLRDTGTNPLRIELKTADGEISGESTPFYIEVKPPNPILICPPSFINRTQSGEETGELQPSIQAIEFMVEFPDDHPRQISVSRLVVDAKVVDEQEGDTIGVLNWDLTPISNSGEHSIQVEVEDSLGLSARTILTPVHVEVVVQEAEQDYDFAEIGLMILGVFFAISMIILIPRFIRWYWQSDSLNKILPARLIKERGNGKDLSKVNDDNNEVLAKLISLESQAGNANDSLNITHSRVWIGCNPGEELFLFTDPSINNAQAVIEHSEENFWINDLDTSEGTWVNYVRIGRQPVKLQTGDILHLGNNGFRFLIVDDKQSGQVTFSNYKPII